MGGLTRQGLPSGPKTIPGGSFVVLPLASALTMFVSGVQMRKSEDAKVRTPRFWERSSINELFGLTLLVYTAKIKATGYHRKCDLHW